MQNKEEGKIKNEALVKAFENMENEGCKVFFIDEYTSIVYLLIESSLSRDSSSEFISEDRSDFSDNFGKKN